MLPVESHSLRGLHRVPVLREIRLTGANVMTAHPRIRACKFDLAQTGDDSVTIGHHIVLHIVKGLP
jgi:hypothetical protein